MQLETCHLGRVQGVQRTIHTGHYGGRPRLSEADKDRLEQRRAFAQAILSDRVPWLDERKMSVIRWRYFYALSQEQIAERLGVSQQRVSQIEAEALAHLRKIFEEGL